MTTTHPVDSTRPSMGTIPNEDLDRLIAATAAEHAELDAKYAHVPPPADAREVHDWEDNGGELPERHFWGTLIECGQNAGVSVHGFQRGDGVVTERWIVAYNTDEMIAPTARSVAEALFEVADELD